VIGVSRVSSSKKLEPEISSGLEGKVIASRPGPTEPKARSLTRVLSCTGKGFSGGDFGSGDLYFTSLPLTRQAYSRRLLSITSENTSYKIPT
jgi:hypothetical protein